MKERRVYRFVAALLSVILLLSPLDAYAKAASYTDTGIRMQIQASGVYSNWEGVSNVSQFLDKNGNYCFAYATAKKVIVVKTKNGKVVKKRVTLKRKASLFGGVACDSSGNYYLVEGNANESSDMEKNTIFVSKYNSNGKFIKKVGDNGGSSLAYYYSADFHTKIPFDAGNCDIAINGDYLAVNYAREMYSGHQSNSVLIINTKTMKKLPQEDLYNSHSFAQRATPYGDGFLFASEGDAYNRAFTISLVEDPAEGKNVTSDIFHFWMPEGQSNNMYVVNNNFAHMGGLVTTGKKAALVATSAKALNSKAASQKEQLFIQIFDPAGNLGEASAYTTSGKRSGVSGLSGTQQVKDYGVKWLTDYSGSYTISNPQAVADQKGNIVVLYELNRLGVYQGVYYIVVSGKGKVIKKQTCYSATARLNPCEMPVCAKNGKICWTGNATGSSEMYIYSLKL